PVVQLAVQAVLPVDGRQHRAHLVLVVGEREARGCLELLGELAAGGLARPLADDVGLVEGAGAHAEGVCGLAALVYRAGWTSGGCRAPSEVARLVVRQQAGLVRVVCNPAQAPQRVRSEEHTSELQSRE